MKIVQLSIPCSIKVNGFLVFENKFAGWLILSQQLIRKFHRKFSRSWVIIWRENVDGKFLEIFEEEKQAVIDAKENPETVNYLVGKVMQKTKGKADPTKTLELIKSKRRSSTRSIDLHSRSRLIGIKLLKKLIKLWHM